VLLQQQQWQPPLPLPHMVAAAKRMALLVRHLVMLMTAMLMWMLRLAVQAGAMAGQQPISSSRAVVVVLLAGQQGQAGLCVTQYASQSR
jgi:hypothetical protein